MAEVLVQVPITLEEEPRVEAENPDAIEQLSFPKLDGTLFPIVVENADMIAPCPWMGGDEVSLTVALNNYYQPMTEENADEVIADVQAFLANQLQKEEEKLSEPEVESLILPQEEVIGVELGDTTLPRDSDTEKAPLKKSPYIQPKPIEPPVVVETVTDTPRPVENDTEATVEAVPTAQELVREAPAHTKETVVVPEATPLDMTAVTEAEDDRAPREDIPVARQVADDVPEPTPIQEKNPELTTVTTPAIPEIDHADVAQMGTPHDTVVSENGEDLDISGLREEAAGAAELADNPSSVFVPTDETTEPASEMPESTVQEEATTDYESEPELPVVYYDQNPDSENEELTNPASAQTNESSVSVDPAVEKIEQLIAELARAADSQETAEPEANEAAENEVEPQDDLRALYAELLDDMQLVQRPEFEDLKKSLTVELGLEDEAGILERLEEIEDPVLQRVIHKTIKALAAIITTTKKTITRIGRSALRLQAIEPLT